MIVGFSLQRVEAEKKTPGQGKLNINYNSSIEDVTEATVSAIDESVARITFSLPISYQQGDTEVAEIQFGGSVLWQKDAADVIEQWEEDGSLDKEISTAVTNHVFRKCLTHAVGLADSLDLPSPVPMPRVDN